MSARINAAVAASPTDWRIPLQVANYYSNASNQDEALRWTDKSIKVKETYQNLGTKARLLYASGRKDEAIALAGQAIERGKADKADTAGLEKILADWKAGKM